MHEVVFNGVSFKTALTFITGDQLRGLCALSPGLDLVAEGLGHAPDQIVAAMMWSSRPLAPCTSICVLKQRSEARQNAAHNARTQPRALAWESLPKRI
jgi:hypothetical protein